MDYPEKPTKTGTKELIMKSLKLNILFPVYNEEKRLKNGIQTTYDYLSKKTDIDYILTIVDNASTDRTEEIANALCAEFPDRVKYLRIKEKGVGAAFRAGVSENQCDIVGYMDVDLSTDISHIVQMYEAFCSDDSLDMVNASRWSKQSKTTGRKFYRNITSYGLTFILKTILGMKALDAICGFKFFRKETAEKLVSEAGAEDNGWFYLIELLLRAERNGFKIKELPVRWVDDSKNSTVHTFSLIREYLRQIFSLKRRLRKKE